jgi:hypothetical protein
MKRTTEKNLMVFSGRAHPELAAEVADQLGDLLRELGVCPTAEDHQVLLGGPLHSAHAWVSLVAADYPCGDSPAPWSGCATGDCSW